VLAAQSGGIDMKNLYEKYGPWAVITGATSGTGYEFAKLLAEQGFNLILVARGKEALHKTESTIRNQFNVHVRIVSADLSDANSVRAIEDAARDIDVGLLVNNAGYSITGEFHRVGWDKQEKLIDTILYSPMALTHIFSNKMMTREGGGGIIFVSSSVAYTPMPLWSVYAAGKAALLSFGESISQELKKYNVDVLTICPGAMKTKFQERSGIESNGMNPEKVSRLALASLGARTTMMPGLTNRIIFKGITRVLPRKFTMPLFERMMKNIQREKNSV
jgi:uncharacterized protein